MPLSWQESLSVISANLQKVTTPAIDLWHGRILAADGVAGEEDAWRWIGVHERLARKPVVASDPADSESGRYFGDASGLAYFRAQADAAFRCLLGAGLIEPADPHCFPTRCCASCWLDVVYQIAEQERGPNLLARQRVLRLMPAWYGRSDGDGEAYVVFAFLERDVFSSSAAAIQSILGDALAKKRRRAGEGRSQEQRALGQDAGEAPRPHRLVIDLESNSLSLDGVTFASLDPTGLRLITALEQAMRSGVPVLSANRLSEAVPCCSGGGRTVRRALRRLPAEIRRLVKAKTGAGHWLELPARNRA
jgi:hypothetical protein